MTIVRDWNGGDYDRLATPMEAMGRAVVDRLSLRGDETVVDAGCGSGRVTQALLERLPRGQGHRRRRLRLDDRRRARTPRG